MNLPLSAKLYVAYPAGGLRDALVGRLMEWGYYNLVMSETLDLRDREAVLAFFERELPDYVFYLLPLPAILPPTSAELLPAPPAQWLFDSLRSVNHLADAAYLYDVSKLLCLDASAGLLDEAVFGALPPWSDEQVEELRYASAVTRQAATELCDRYRRQYDCDFISAASSSVYGPGAPQRLGAPLVHALLRRMQQATAEQLPRLQVRGHPHDRHALLHQGDVTDATLFLMARVTQPGLISIEPAQSCSLEELLRLLAEISGYQGQFDFEPRRALPLMPGNDRNSSHTQIEAFAWQASIPLPLGLRSMARPGLQDAPTASD